MNSTERSIAIFICPTYLLLQSFKGPAFKVQIYPLGVSASLTLYDARLSSLFLPGRTAVTYHIISPRDSERESTGLSTEHKHILICAFPQVTNLPESGVHCVIRRRVSKLREVWQSKCTPSTGKYYSTVEAFQGQQYRDVIQSY